jgi:hypothetical protein
MGMRYRDEQEELEKPSVSPGLFLLFESLKQLKAGLRGENYANFNRVEDFSKSVLSSWTLLEPKSSSRS